MSIKWSIYAIIISAQIKLLSMESCRNNSDWCGEVRQTHAQHNNNTSDHFNRSKRYSSHSTDLFKMVKSKVFFKSNLPHHDEIYEVCSGNKF